MNWEGYSEDLKSFEQHSGAEFNLKCPADQAEWGKTTEGRRQRAEGSEETLQVGGTLRFRLEAPAFAKAMARQGGQKPEVRDQTPEVRGNSDF